MARSFVRGITVGPDGNLWFTELVGKIGRITPAGAVTEFPIPGGVSEPIEIVAGPTATLVHRVLQPDRADNSGRARDSPSHSHRVELTALHHSGTGREPLVHRARREPDRARDNRRSDHRVSASRAGGSVRDRQRSGREHLVHRARGQSDRPHDPLRRARGVPDPEGRKRPFGHRGRPGWESMVHRKQREPGGPITRRRGTEFPPPSASNPHGIARGPDGDIGSRNSPPTKSCESDFARRPIPVPGPSASTARRCQTSKGPTNSICRERAHQTIQGEVRHDDTARYRQYGAHWCGVVYDGHMAVSKTSVRQTVSLPSRVARRVHSLAKRQRTSASRVIVDLIESGLEAQEQEKKQFLELADRLVQSSDTSNKIDSRQSWPG